MKHGEVVEALVPEKLPSNPEEITLDTIFRYRELETKQYQKKKQPKIIYRAQGNTRYFENCHEYSPANYSASRK